MKLCTNPRVSTLDVLGLLDCLLGSLEQSALTRAKATLLRKWQTNTRRDKSAQTQAQDKNCESGEYVDDETVTVVAHDVGRQDSRANQVPKAKEQPPTCSISQELCSLYEKTCCQKATLLALGEEQHVLSCRQRRDSIQRKCAKGKETEKGKGKSKQQNTSPKGKSEGKISGKGTQWKDQSFTRMGKARQGTTQERFHRWTSPKRATICAQRKAQVQRQTVIRAKPSFSKHQRHRTQIQMV